MCVPVLKCACVFDQFGLFLFVCVFVCVCSLLHFLLTYFCVSTLSRCTYPYTKTGSAHVCIFLICRIVFPYRFRKNGRI